MLAIIPDDDEGHHGRPLLKYNLAMDLNNKAFIRRYDSLTTHSALSIMRNTLAD